jgi:hypothetical protein
MNRPGSRRIVGVTLLGSAVAMLVLAVLVWGGLLGLAAAGRQIVAGALFVAALIDMRVGLRFIQSR